MNTLVSLLIAATFIGLAAELAHWVVANVTWDLKSMALAAPSWRPLLSGCSIGCAGTLLELRRFEIL